MSDYLFYFMFTLKIRKYSCHVLLKYKKYFPDTMSVVNHFTVT